MEKTRLRGPSASDSPVFPVVTNCAVECGCVRGSDTIVGSTLQMCVRINVRSVNAVFPCIFMYFHPFVSHKYL